MLDGGGGGGGTYNAADETGRQEVEVDIETVYGLAIALSKEVENIGNGRQAVEANFQQTAAPGTMGPYVPGTETPIGRDPRYAAIRNIVEYHGEAMTEAGQLLTNFELGIRILSRITNKIVTEFNSADELNQADVETVRDITQIPKPEVPPPHFGPGPVAV